MAEDNQEVADTPVEENKGEGDTNVDTAALTLDQLNEKLGTTYTSVDDAVSGLKETKNYVGKAGQVEKENKELREQLGQKPEGDFVSKEQYEQDMFYSKNSELEPYKDIINARAKELNIRPADAVESDDSLKQTLEKLRGFDKQENAKSVLMSNSRLGQVDDKMEKANEAVKTGDYRAAADNAVKAVTETFSDQ